MAKPEYYDATDGKAVVVQKPVLEKLIRDAKNGGLKIGSWWGSLTLGGQAVFSLATTKEFSPLGGLSGATWQAIFIIVALIAIIIFVVLSVLLAPKFFKNLFGKDHENEHLFTDDKKIN